MAVQHEAFDFRGTRCVRLRHDDGATAIIALHGAQVLSWTPADGRERLFLGERADFAPGGAIRGGIPVVFPQFADRGTLRKHGFARLQDWTFEDVVEDVAVFTLHDGPGSAAWPHRFACRVAVALAARGLSVTLEVENRDHASFAFSAALHTYLCVGDIAQVALEGLQGCDYEDSANGGTLHRETADALRFEGELDRIYGDVVAPLSLVEEGRRLGVEQDGFSDVVVWNPGDALARRIGDLAPGEYRRFACVEAGQVLQPVMLAPGERWRGSQVLGD